jgi:DNA mismatch endonuclease (patch repair protein)
MTTVPGASSEAASRRLKQQRRRDTKPELVLRRELHRRGLRYRTEMPVVDGRRRHDIVFGSAKVVVDVRGCFWHRCPDHGTLPKANSEWWRAKLEANRERDLDTESRLAEAGWSLIVVWEHDDPVATADVIESALRERSTSRQRTKRFGQAQSQGEAGAVVAAGEPSADSVSGTR